MNWYVTTTSLKDKNVILRGNYEYEFKKNLLDYCIFNLRNCIPKTDSISILCPERLCPISQYNGVDILRIKTHLLPSDVGYDEASEIMNFISSNRERYGKDVILDINKDTYRNKNFGDTEHNILFNNSADKLKYPCIIIDGDLIISDYKSSFWESCEHPAKLWNTSFVYLPNKGFNYNFLKDKISLNFFPYNKVNAIHIDDTTYKAVMGFLEFIKERESFS